MAEKPHMLKHTHIHLFRIETKYLTEKQSTVPPAPPLKKKSKKASKA